MMPTAGGDFDYLNRAFGPQIGFAFAWYNFFVGKSASQAIIATM
jgi:amino acid transporter